MNIFEALEKGNGKATFYELRNIKYWFIGDSKKLMVCDEARIYESGLQICTEKDWIPYVPRETCTEQQWSKYYKQYDEALAIGFSPETIEKVLVKPKLNEKVKHKEVFENVKWSKWGTSTLVFPLIPSDVSRFLGVPSMRITLEWEGE